MGAAIAAVLLDREARSTSIAADATHGMLRAPLDQYIHVLRAMEVAPVAAIELNADAIGQQVMRAPSVFSFYKPGCNDPSSKRCLFSLYNSCCSGSIFVFSVPLLLLFIPSMLPCFRRLAI